MSELKERLTFIASAVLYLIVNLKVGSTAMVTAKATGLQILQTAPYVIGLTIIVVALLQYMAGNKKMPWDRRIRIFFAIGIMAGLINGIYHYAAPGGLGQ